MVANTASTSTEKNPTRHWDPPNRKSSTRALVTAAPGSGAASGGIASPASAEYQCGLSNDGERQSVIGRRRGSGALGSRSRMTWLKTLPARP